MLFLDTSALVKRYVEEQDSDALIRLWDAGDPIAVSVITFAEALGALNRRRRESTLSEAQYKLARGHLENDWARLTRIDVTNRLDPYLRRLSYRHPLRGMDAIQLVTAQLLSETLNDALDFVTADIRLLNIARAEGLRVVSPPDFVVASEGRKNE